MIHRGFSPKESKESKDPKKKAYSRWIRLDASPTNILQLILNNQCSDYMRFFRFRVNLKRQNWLISQRCRCALPRFPDSNEASSPAEMCNQSQDLLHSIPVPSARATSRVSYLCHSCSGWVHSKCSDLKDARQYKRTKDWACKTCSSAPAPPPTQPPPAPTTTSKPKDDTFNILQFNANGVGNKLLEWERFLEKHNVKVAAIQESKLTSKSRKPCIKNFTTVRRDRPQGQGGGLLIFIHNSINFHQQPQSPETLSDLHLEELTISAKAGKYRADHLQHLYSPNKFLHSWISTFNRSSDDDPGYFRTGWLQRTPLFLARNVNRY